MNGSIRWRTVRFRSFVLCWSRLGINFPFCDIFHSRFGLCPEHKPHGFSVSSLSFVNKVFDEIAQREWKSWTAKQDEVNSFGLRLEIDLALTSFKHLGNSIYFFQFLYCFFPLCHLDPKIRFIIIIFYPFTINPFYFLNCQYIMY